MHVKEFEQQGAELWAISPDEIESLAKFQSDEGFSYPLLIDSYDEVTNAYGLVNPERPSVPHPTALIIDRAGIVQYIRVDENYRVRPSAEELLDALEAIESE